MNNQRTQFHPFNLVHELEEIVYHLFNMLLLNVELEWLDKKLRKPRKTCINDFIIKTNKMANSI